MTKYLTRFSTYTLLVALTISAVAEFYSIVGLTAIFAAAVVPTIIMGIALGLGKITATVWLKLNWERAPLSYKLYLIPAVVTLMFLTSIGCFGFLSKAHSDQSLVSGDVQSKIAIYDEKIKTEKENIEANRKALKQMDEGVDQVLGRSTDEKGADKAVAMRRSQQKERSRLQSEILQSQKSIQELNEARAPIAAEVRKVEAEIGPIKYIAAMIYGDNTDENMLEASVRWVIVIIVAVLDPLALILLLAAQQSFRWDREREYEESVIHDSWVADVGEKPTPEDLEEDLTDVNFELSENAVSNETIIDEVEPVVILPEKTIKFVDSGEHHKDVLEYDDSGKSPIVEIEYDMYLQEDDVQDSLENSKNTDEISILEKHPYLNTPFVHFTDTKPLVIQSKEEESHNTNSVVEEEKFPKHVDENLSENLKVESEILTLGIDDVERPGDYIVEPSASSNEITVDSTEPIAPEIDTENVTTEKVLFDPKEGYVMFDGKKMSIDNLRSIRPDLILPADGTVPNRIDFGSEFPKLSLSGDTYIRIDNIPHRVYKFNKNKWIIVDKVQNTTYLTNVAYIRYMIQQLENGGYDPELLTYAEEDEIAAYLNSKNKI